MKKSETKVYPILSEQELYDILTEAYTLYRRAESYYDMADVITSAPLNQNGDCEEYLQSFVKDNPQNAHKIHPSLPAARPVSKNQAKKGVKAHEPKAPDFATFAREVIQDAAKIDLIRAYKSIPEDEASADLRNDTNHNYAFLLNNTPDKNLNIIAEGRNLVKAHYDKNIATQRIEDFSKSLNTLDGELENNSLSAASLTKAAEYSIARATTLLKVFKTTIRQNKQGYDHVKHRVSKDGYGKNLYEQFVNNSSVAASGELENSLNGFRNEIIFERFDGDTDLNPIYKVWESNQASGNTPPISTEVWEKYIAPFCKMTEQQQPQKLEINRTLRSWLKHQVATELADDGAESLQIGRIETTLNDDSFNQRTKAWKDVLNQLQGNRHKLSTSSDEHYTDFTNHFTTEINVSPLIDDETKQQAIEKVHEHMPFTDTEIDANNTRAEAAEALSR